jgi:hypothetical protein
MNLKIKIIQIFCLFFFISCSNVFDLPDGSYYTISKGDVQGDVEALKTFNKYNFTELIPLSSKQEFELRKIIGNKVFHEKSNLGTCMVSDCFLVIKNKKVISKSYLTCNGVQIVRYNFENFIESTLLNDVGVNKMDSLINSIKDSKITQ